MSCSVAELMRLSGSEALTANRGERVEASATAREAKPSSLSSLLDANPRERLVRTASRSSVRVPSEWLYRLVDAAYEKRAIAISSNLHPAGFDELMPKTIATATVDRLLHHAHVCQTSGDSVRLSQALAGQGVKPLS